MNNNHKRDNVRVPVQRRSIGKKSEIINTAYTLFSKNNFDDVSIRMISKEANVSIGAIYSYFADKQDVFIEVAKQYSKDLFAFLYTSIEHDISKSATIEEALYKLIIKEKEIISLNFNLHIELVRLSMIDSRIREHHVQQEASSAQKIGTLFNKHFKIEIQDPEVAIFIIHKTIEEIIQYLLIFNVDIPEKRVFREMSLMIASYLEYKKRTLPIKSI